MIVNITVLVMTNSRKVGEAGMKEMIARVGDMLKPSGIESVFLTGEDLVRCKDCKHRPKEPDWETYESGFDIKFPEGSKCPCQCSGDQYCSWYPKDDWYCADGKRKED